HVEPAEPLLGETDHLVDLSGLAHVGRDEQCLGVPGLWHRLGLVPATDHDTGAGAEEPLRDPASDTTTPAGDDHSFARQVERISHADKVAVTSDAPSDQERDGHLA